MPGSGKLGDFVLLNTFLLQIYRPLNFIGFVYRELRQGLALAAIGLAIGLVGAAIVVSLLAFAADAAKVVRLSAANGDKRDINQRASEYLQWQALKPAGTDND